MEDRPRISSDRANVADLLWDAAAQFGSRPAVITADSSRSWSALAGAAARAARRFSELGEAGDRIIVNLPTSPASLVAMFGIGAAGLVAVPVATGADSTDIAKRVGATAVIGGPVGSLPRVTADEIDSLFSADSSASAPEPNRRGGEDLAVLARAGSDRPVMISHRAILAAVRAIGAAPALKLKSDDRALIVLPLSHLAGWVTAFLPLAAVGGAAVIPAEPAGPGEWIDTVLDAVRGHRVTVIPASPSLYRRLGVPQVERALASVRLMTSGAAPLDPVDAAAVRQATGLSVWEGYGIAESSSAVATSLMTSTPRRGSVGLPLPGIELRLLVDDPDEIDLEPAPVVEEIAAEPAEAPLSAEETESTASTGSDVSADGPDDDQSSAAKPERVEPAPRPVDTRDTEVIADVPGDGEPGRIALRGETLFSGYWPDGSDGPDEDGWFVTGDVGYFDDAGELHLVDRFAESLSVAGFTFYPREIEAVLTSHPYVRDAAVIAVPGRVGETALAVLVAQRGTHPTAADLDEFMAARLPVFKRPAHYRLVDRLPRTAVGRIDRDLVRQNYLADPDPVPPIRVAAGEAAAASPAAVDTEPTTTEPSERRGLIRTLRLRLPGLSRASEPSRPATDSSNEDSNPGADEPSVKKPVKTAPTEQPVALHHAGDDEDLF